MLFTIRNGSSLNSSIITHHTFDELGGADIVVSQMGDYESDEYLTPTYDRER